MPTAQPPEAAGTAGTGRSRGGRTTEAGNATQKALRIVEAALASGGRRRLADIAADAGVPKPSTHRILATLTSEGFLDAEQGGWYSAGPRLRALAAKVSGTDADQPADVLRRLQRDVGQTVHLAVRSGDHATYIDKVDADQPYRMASRVGMRIPLHCTAIGKSLLATLPRAEVDAIADRCGLPRRTPRTITSRRALHAELAHVRAQGYALDDEENEATVRCLAVPVPGRDAAAVAAVSVSTVTFLVDVDTLRSYVPVLRAAADALAGGLGS